MILLKIFLTSVVLLGTTILIGRLFDFEGDVIDYFLGGLLAVFFVVAFVTALASIWLLVP